MGAFQIMGINWKQMGYSSVTEFTKRCLVRKKIRAFVFFLKKVTPAILATLKKQEWSEAARFYNGPKHKQNNYDEKLHIAYERFKEN